MQNDFLIKKFWLKLIFSLKKMERREILKLKPFITNLFKSCHNLQLCYKSNDILSFFPNK